MRGVFWTIGVGSLALVAWIVAARQSSSSVEPRPVYRTEPASRGPIIASIAASGKVTPTETAFVASRVAGQVVEVLADFNSEVQAGQVLVRLDREALAVRRDVIMAELVEARAARQRAMVQAEQVRAELDPIAGAPQKVAGLQAGLRLAEAQLDAGNALVARNEALLRQAELDLAAAEIRAPIDGVIIQRQVERGQNVGTSPQDPPLFVIAQSLRLVEIPVAVDESEVGRLKVGQDVEITLADRAGMPYRGRVKQVRLAAQAARAGVAYTIVVEVPNEELALRPGMSADVRIITERRPEVLRVPNAALRWQPANARPAAAGASGNGQAVTLSVDADNPAGPFVDPATSPFGVAWFEAMKTDLGLTAAQTREIGHLAEAMRREVQEAGSDPAQRREAMRAARQRFNRAMEPLLTVAQLQTFRVLQEARRNRSTGDRRNAIVLGRVFVLDDRGLPRGVTVRIGATDGLFTEVIGEELSSRDELVVETVTAPAERPASGPFRIGF